MTEGYTITKQTIVSKSCFGCDHYKHTMLRSGRHPEYKNSCSHPKAVEEAYGKPSRHTDVTFTLNITPDWCPVGKRK